MINFPVFSFDLVKACKRNEGFFKDMTIAEIEACVEEYKKFWALTKKYPSSPFCPTQTIDEVWHLHMLHPQHYYDDSLEYFDAILGHDAGIGRKEEEIPIVNKMFDTGSDLWEKEYGYRLEERAYPEN